MKSFLPQILNDFANDPYVLGVFQREIFQGHCAVFDSKGYQSMMESYRSAAGSGLPESEPYTAKYIDALNKFALNGVVPPTYKYDAENNPFMLDSSQQKRTGLTDTDAQIVRCRQYLFKIAACLQPSPKVASPKILISKTLTQLKADLKSLLTETSLTEVQRRDAITLKMIQKEISTALEVAPRYGN